MTAMRRHDTRDKRIERLEAECERLRRELAKKEECMAFLPPESFLSYYALLVEAVYLTKQPEPEVKTHQLRRQGSQIPVRNYKLFRLIMASSITVRHSFCSKLLKLFALDIGSE